MKKRSQKSKRSSKNPRSIRTISKQKKPAARIVARAEEGKLPADTIDTWLSKQVKIVNRTGNLPSGEEQPQLASVVVKDTFEAWIEKQKPKEASTAVKERNEVAPDTFEVWMRHQVTKLQATTAAVVASSGSQYVVKKRGSTDMVPAPASDLMNPDIKSALSTAEELTITVTGRKSGKKIPAPVWFVQENNDVFLLPMKGSHSNWFKNLKANPSVDISVGGMARFGLLASLSDDKEMTGRVADKFRAKYGIDEVKKYYTNLDAFVKTTL